MIRPVLWYQSVNHVSASIPLKFGAARCCMLTSVERIWNSTLKPCGVIKQAFALVDVGIRPANLGSPAGARIRRLLSFGVGTISQRFALGISGDIKNTFLRGFGEIFVGAGAIVNVCDHGCSLLALASAQLRWNSLLGACISIDIGRCDQRVLFVHSHLWPVDVSVRRRHRGRM